jgi:hypothetical protein
MLRNSFLYKMDNLNEILNLLYITHLKTAFFMDFQARSGSVLVCFSYVSRSRCALTCFQMASFLVYSSFRDFCDTNLKKEQFNVRRHSRLKERREEIAHRLSLMKLILKSDSQANSLIGV